MTTYPIGPVNRRETPGPMEPCPKCSQVHDPRKCAGHVDEEGKPIRPCGRFPRRGSNVCPKHGGDAPQVRAAARRRLEQQRVDAELGRLLVELEADYAGVDPTEVLVEQVQRSAAMVAVLGAIVGRLDPERLWDRERLEIIDLGSDDDGNPRQDVVGVGRALPHVAVEMYREWTAQAAKIAKLAIDAGVDERRVRLAERHGELLAGVVRTILVDLGVLLDVDLLGRQDVLGLVRNAFLAIDTTAREGAA